MENERKQEYWDRFRKAQDSRFNENSYCHRCDFGERFEYLEKLTIAPEAYRNWPNYRDGCLVQDGYRPKSDSPQCQLCFKDWVEERKDEGKICIRCGKWIIGGKSKAALYIEATEEWADGKQFKKYSSVCEPCLLNGKTVDEWAKDVVDKAKKAKELGSV